jgi:hypothetical protein
MTPSTAARVTTASRAAKASSYAAGRGCSGARRYSTETTMAGTAAARDAAYLRLHITELKPKTEPKKT